MEQLRALCSVFVSPFFGQYLPYIALPQQLEVWTNAASFSFTLRAAVAGQW